MEWSCTWVRGSEGRQEICPNNRWVGSMASCEHDPGREKIERAPLRACQPSHPHRGWQVVHSTQPSGRTDGIEILLLQSKTWHEQAIGEKIDHTRRNLKFTLFAGHFPLTLMLFLQGSSLYKFVNLLAFYPYSPPLSSLRFHGISRVRSTIIMCKRTHLKIS